MDDWGRDRVADLVELTDAALPSERLTRDELLACCWDDPGVVLATPDGTGAVAVVVRRSDDYVAGFLKLIAVHPGARRQGHGRALLRVAERWAWEQGADALHLAGSAPFYLWPGVDVRATPMQCLVESAGYRETGAAFDMSVPATFRRPTPEGVEIRRTVDDEDAGAVDRLVERLWPEWLDEQRRATEQGMCLGAFDAASGVVLGFACHSVNRAGWFGPTGTEPEHRGRGIGHALLSEVCRDLMVAGYTDVEICWIGPFRFYATAGGAMSRTFRTFRRSQP